MEYHSCVSGWGLSHPVFETFWELPDWCRCCGLTPRWSDSQFYHLCEHQLFLKNGQKCSLTCHWLLSDILKVHIFSNFYQKCRQKFLNPNHLFVFMESWFSKSKVNKNLNLCIFTAKTIVCRHFALIRTTFYCKYSDFLLGPLICLQDEKLLKESCS